MPPLPSPSCRSALFARRFVGGRPDWAQIESPDNLTTENRRTASPPPEKRLTGENESSARCRRALEKLPGLPFCSRFGNTCIQRGAELLDESLLGLDIKKENVVHPVGYFYD